MGQFTARIGNKGKGQSVFPGKLLVAFGYIGTHPKNDRSEIFYFFEMVSEGTSFSCAVEGEIPGVEVQNQAVLVPSI